MWIPIYICIGVIWGIIRFTGLSMLYLGTIKYNYWRPKWFIIWLIETVFAWPINILTVIICIILLFIGKTRQFVIDGIDDMNETFFDGYEEL